MRTLMIGGDLAMLVVASGCGGSSSSSASEEALQRDSDLYAISQIEKTFHEAISKKDIDQMMGLYAPNATATFGPGQTVSGKDRSGGVAESVAFKPETNWLSDHPAYKLKVTSRRRPWHASLRVPLRRHAHAEGRGGHGRHQDVARIDDAG